MRVLPPLGLALAVLLLACTGPEVPEDGTETGIQYGTDGAVAWIRPDRLTLELGCGGGSTDGPIRPGPDGRFAVSGYFYVGPVVPADSPAQYSGVLLFNWLVLEIRPVSSPDVVFRYQLQRGEGNLGFLCR